MPETMSIPRIWGVWIMVYGRQTQNVFHNYRYIFTQRKSTWHNKLQNLRHSWTLQTFEILKWKMLHSIIQNSGFKLLPSKSLNV
jgi:hypothetical protein